jgi:ferritin-like metal-binding protein YciE
MEALQQLLIHELADIYDAEEQILKALPKLIEAASSRELQQALTQHRAITEKQVTRLDQVFRQLGEERPRQRCKGMAGLVAEGEDLLKEDFEEATQDAGIIGAAQRVEHYEIAAYGTARTLAGFLGNRQVAALLEQTLEEEKEADQLLTQIAESSINAEARAEEDEREGDEERSRPGSGGGNGRSRASKSSASSAKRSKASPARRRNRRTKAKTSR